ncbi:MAG: response regulator [Verrucomicrobia bacterium]|nr:response regulator [Verrucomicrobiota bacterium]MBV9275787.1 response regulator [Verrucomicrobiota bacterium]
MKRILIVDDEPNVRLNYRITLEVEGHQVIETASGTEALKRLKLGKFDLAILDMRMPGMSGLDLLAAMRAQKIRTPAIIVTAYSDVPNAVRAIQLGASDFLQKPLRPDDLRRVANEVMLRNSEPAAPSDDMLNQFDHSVAEARRLIQSGDLNAAKAHVLRAVELNADPAESFSVAAELAEKSGDVERARKLYEAAIKLDDQNASAKLGLRRIFQSLHAIELQRPAGSL